jgi:hypothetical protein
MMNAELRCRCGQVRGQVADPSPRTVNRVVCYCADCQAFAHRLGRADLLNAQGGSDIVQVAPAALTFVQGQDRITGLRLTPKGLYRWHTSCCNTPIGNTLGPAIPFVGIVAKAFDHGTQRADDVFGKPVGAILGKYAVGEPPAGSTGISLSFLLRSLGKVLVAARWQGLAASVLQARNARADLSADRAVARRARGIASALRPASGTSLRLRCVGWVSRRRNPPPSSPGNGGLRYASPPYDAFNFSAAIGAK